MSQKILITEDDAILRDILIHKLQNAGYTIIAAEDGESTLALARSEKPDLILLDVLLPKKNGEEVLREMGADAELSKIPVIAISNSADPAEVEKIRTLGAREFLVKALFDSNQVLEKVKGVLGASTPPETKPLEPSFTPGHSTQMGATQTAPLSPPAATGPSMPAPSVHTGERHKILIVEDDKFLREIAAGKLEREGFIVLGATDGPTAVEMIVKEKPEVVILDLILPGMSGYEVLQTIRAKPEFKDLPILVLSNMGQEEDIRKAKEAGATDYMIKAHFSFGEIIKKLREVI